MTGYLPKSDYQIRTPAAAIAIRGSIHNIDFAPSGATTAFVGQGVALVPVTARTVAA